MTQEKLVSILPAPGLFRDRDLDREGPIWRLPWAVAGTMRKKKKPFFSLGSAGCEKQAAGATSGPLWHHVGRTKLNKVNPVTGRQTDRVTSSDQTGTSLALAWKVPCPRPPSDLGTQGRLVTSQRQSPAYTVPSLDPALLGGPPWAPQFYDPVSSGVCLSNFELCFCHMQLKES